MPIVSTLCYGTICRPRRLTPNKIGRGAQDKRLKIVSAENVVIGYVLLPLHVQRAAFFMYMADFKVYLGKYKSYKTTFYGEELFPPYNKK